MKHTLITVLLNLLWALPLFPLQVQLSHPEFNPKGPNKSRTVMVINDENTNKAIEISAHLRSHTLEGEEVRKKTKDFDIYPTQLILLPRQEQVVTIRYKGETQFTKEKAYRLIVEELPINLTKTPTAQENTSSGINLMIRFIKSLYVIPNPSAKPNIIISDARIKRSKEKDWLSITLENTGSKHRVLSEITAEFTSTSVPSTAPTTLKINKEALGISNFLAGDKRDIKVPWPTSLPKGEIRSKITALK